MVAAGFVTAGTTSYAQVFVDGIECGIGPTSGTIDPDNGGAVANTLFVVASKSGSTLEPNIFNQYFFERARQVLGRHPGDLLAGIIEETSAFPSWPRLKTCRGDGREGFLTGVVHVGISSHLL